MKLFQIFFSPRQWRGSGDPLTAHALIYATITTKLSGTFSLTFYIYYKAILKVFQILICGNAAAIEVTARGMRAENLTKFFKFRTNVRSSKFDFKSQIFRRPRPEQSHSSFTPVGRSSFTAAIRSSWPAEICSCPAAPSCSSSTAHTCGAWPRHTNVCSERMFELVPSNC